MLRSSLALAFAVALLAVPAAAQRPPLTVTDPEDAIGCGEMTGRYVSFARPGVGVVLLSAEPFPGSRPAGEVVDGALALTLPGVEPLTFGVSGAAGTVHGLLDRAIAPPAPGCVSFDKDRFTWESDLRTYLRALWEDALAAVSGAAPAISSHLHVGERTVRLTVGGEGVVPLEIGAVEGGLAGMRLTGQDAVWYVRPFVVAGGESTVVEVLSGAGAVYAADGPTRVAVVAVGRQAPTAVPGAPFNLQLAGIVGE